MTERLSLHDLRRKSGIVKHLDAEIEVHGLSARDILDLMDRYAEVNKFLVGLAISAEEAKKNAPGIQAAIIVRGMRHSKGDALPLDEAEAIAADLPAGLSFSLFTAIWNLTFTEGFGPFMLAVKTLVDTANVAAGRGQATPSGKPSRAMRRPTPDAPGAQDSTASASPPENSPPGTSSPRAESSAELVT